MPLRNATCEALDQVVALVKLTRHQYTAEPGAGLSPIGTHIRHIVDHFWALQCGLESQYVDYNRRHRGTRIETDPDMATQALLALRTWVLSITRQPVTFTVVSETSISREQTAQTTSTLERELIYLINHTVHHIAYTTLLARSLNIDIPEHFGLAPATATHLRHKAVLCSS
jgi:uncharacterized damage-inducible protein DinB